MSLLIWKYDVILMDFLFSSLAEALQLLKKIESHSELMLAQTHPLQGELADATARAYATMGKNGDAVASVYHNWGCLFACCQDFICPSIKNSVFTILIHSKK